jgi:hypothetical protein
LHDLRALIKPKIAHAHRAAKDNIKKLKELQKEKMNENALKSNHKNNM